MPPSGDYDAALLQAAPSVDKRAIQEGYSADLLNEAEKPLIAPKPPKPPPQHPGPREPSIVEAQTPPPKPKPFYKTTKGLIIIGVVFIVVIVAAVVGGVVGSRSATPKAPPGQTVGDGQTVGGPTEGEQGASVSPGASPSPTIGLSFPTLSRPGSPAPTENPEGTPGSNDPDSPGRPDNAGRGSVSGLELNGVLNGAFGN
ncbi:hypothetical protein FA15DRAFT_666898 [Coprinopsis marcescibilis]|uniref:Uncharacterized protein n=1 Tax=Coprinopsis marcescibilis TaxID=230819 RepID=A0A5C3L2A1_COPMA|nr:hypothetical protein FA15DRAFT_666898 [Coprinopsis marcescibilis]